MSKKFEPYVTQEEAEEGLRIGNFVSGVLRVNAKKPSDGFCVTGKGDILVKGKFDRNRAFNGDTIVVEIFPKEDWHRTTPEDDDAAPGSRVGGPLDVSVPDEDKDEILLTGLDFVKLSGGVFQAAQQAPKVASSLAEMEAPADVMKTGRVVYVSNCVWKERMYACSLQGNKMDSPDPQLISGTDTLIRAVPIDKRIPWILIMLNDTVKKILNLPGKLDKEMLYPIQVQKWAENGALPLGRIKGVAYGKVGEPDVEARVCMAEQDLGDHELDFPKPVHDEVEAMVADFWRELESEAKKRIDLRKKRIFTIDPMTARDLDDAIHIDVINEEFVEIGVHIADVSHYVKEHSQTDKVAQERCTSVYLAHRVYPMLPEGLCNQLCSLNPNEPKLTFTSWFRIRRATGEVILDSKDPNGPRFAKTVIQSCCRYSYEEVQDVLDGIAIPLTKRPTVFGSHNSWESLEKDLFMLYDVCGKVRDLRFEHGSIRIDKNKMRFKLDEDDVPSGYSFETHSPSHWMIEELMLLANKVVAVKICEIGDAAVLRNHPAPEPKSFAKLSENIRTKLGVPEWDGATSGALFQSIKIVKERLGPKIGALIEFLVMKTMKPAAYCAQSSGYLRHYALSFDHYTHFTSPIRRYPDIMVHRQLQTVLELNACGLDPKVGAPDLIAIENQCVKCNVMKKKSREAQEACDVSFYCIYLRKRKELSVTTGTVMSIMEKCVNVFVPLINKDVPVFFTLHAKVPDWFLEGDAKRVQLDEIMKGPDTISRASETLATVQWRKSESVSDIALFDSVKIVIVPMDTVPISYAVRLLPPWQTLPVSEEL